MAPQGHIAHSQRATHLRVEAIFGFRGKFIFVPSLFLSTSCIVKENGL